MSIVEKNVQLFGGALDNKKKPNIKQNASDESPSDTSCLNSRPSRVSKLRDMFQTGDIHPIEEFEEYIVTPITDKNLSDTQVRFLRSCPGSPPLLALRSHRANSSKPLALSRKSETTVSNGNLSSANSSATHRSSASTAPPVRPPKPKNLLLNLGINPQLLFASGKTKGSSALKKYISLFDRGGMQSNVNQNIQKPLRPRSDVSKSTFVERPSFPQPATSVSPVPTTSITEPNLTAASTLPKLGQTESKQVAHVEPVVITCDLSSPTILRLRTPTPDVKDLASNAVPLSDSAPHSDKEGSGSDGFSFSDSNRISSWQCHPSLDRIGTDLSGDIADFQHAEPIALTTPDDGEEDGEDEEEELLSSSQGNVDFPNDTGGQTDGVVYSTVPQLAVPTGLKVVAVDPDGVHIFEDGNFFFSLPGLSRDPPASPSDMSLLSSISGKSATSDVSRVEDRSLNITNPPDAVNDTRLSLPDSNNDALNKHVRFSTEPVLVYSTHSTSEYDRHNDEIDPVAASAEYEMEKRLDEMDLISVDLHRGDDSLGIAIIGLGVDCKSGDGKLGIFIKQLIPGGPAEATGKIQLFDQIVEVDGVSLVGVSQQFAAQTIRSTGPIVHFVLGREKDPANSRVAQLFAAPPDEVEEDAEEDEAENDDEEEEQSNQFVAMNSPNVQTPTSDRSAMPTHDDSAEASSYQILAAADVSPCEDLEVTNADSSMFDFSFTPNLVFNTNVNHFEAHDEMTHANFANVGVISPPSALKGTATAASTRRRQDAIIRLIEVARQRAMNEQSNGVSPSSCAIADNEAANTITWILAGDLYANQCQVMKLQSQMQILEQRLTAQEAAADEAIERLCIQCRHLEFELQKSQAQLNAHTLHYVPQNGNAYDSTDVESNPHHFTRLNGLPTSPTNSQLSPSSSVVVNAEASKVGDLFGSDPCSARLGLLEQVDHAEPWADVRHRAQDASAPESKFHADTPSDDESEQATFYTALSDSNKTPVQPATYVRDRMRLLSSGGLSNRRPRTRIEVNPPPFSVLDADTLFHNNQMSLPVPSCAVNCGSDGVSDNNQLHTDVLLDDYCSVAKGTSSSTVSPREPSHLASPPRTSNSTLSVRLPGMNDGSFQSVVLRRRSSNGDKFPASSGIVSMVKHDDE